MLPSFVNTLSKYYYIIHWIHKRIFQVRKKKVLSIPLIDRAGAGPFPLQDNEIVAVPRNCYCKYEIKDNFVFQFINKYRFIIGNNNI